MRVRPPLHAVLRAGGAAVVLMTMPLLAGCQAELGECSEAAARQKVYYWAPSTERHGTPAYEGQALLLQNCANGQCHASGIEGALRRGVPHGYDFSVDVACSLEEDGACIERDRDQYDQLVRNQRRVFDEGRAIFTAVEDGSMPPSGYVVHTEVGEPGYYRGAQMSPVFTENERGAPLPAIDSPEGQEILRNWLKCGSPIIAATRPPDRGGSPGMLCTLVEDEGFDCITRYEPPPPPTAEWPSIFEFFQGGCVINCHDGDESSESFMESQLDLSDEAVAYAALVSAQAQGDECGGADPARVLVVPGDPDASLLIDKLDGSTTCGDAMPPGNGFQLTEEYIAPIREWIMNGAPES